MICTVKKAGRGVQDLYAVANQNWNKMTGRPADNSADHASGMLGYNPNFSRVITSVFGCVTKRFWLRDHLSDDTFLKYFEGHETIK
jgi:hypothetical protein